MATFRDSVKQEYGRSPTFREESDFKDLILEEMHPDGKLPPTLEEYTRSVNEVLEDGTDVPLLQTP